MASECCAWFICAFRACCVSMFNNQIDSPLNYSIVVKAKKKFREFNSGHEKLLFQEIHL